MNKAVGSISSIRQEWGGARLLAGVMTAALVILTLVLAAGCAKDDDGGGDDDGSYTVTFDAQGGTVTPKSAKTNTSGKLASLPTPTRDGYTFDGWYREKEYKNAVSASRIYTQNTTIYAKWAAESIASANDSTAWINGDEGLIFRFNGEFVTIRSDSANNWSVVEGEGGTWTSKGDSLTMTYDTPNAQRPTVSILIFTLKDGVLTVKKDGKTIQYTKKTDVTVVIINIYVITYADGKFVAKGQDGTEVASNASIQPVIDAVRKAAGGRDVTVQFGDGEAELDIGTGTARFENSGSEKWGNITIGGRITGRNTGASTGVIYISADVTVILRVIYVTNTGSGGNGVYHNCACTLDIYDATITATAGSGTGIRNAGGGTVNIYSGSISGGPSGYSIYNSGKGSIIIINLIYVIIIGDTFGWDWDPDPNPDTTAYTVTFDPNGGTVSPTSAKTGTNGRLASLPAPTRSGYTFDGWYTAKTGGTAVTTSTTFSANTTVYARWTEAAVPPSGSLVCGSGELWEDDGGTFGASIIFRSNGEILFAHKEGNTWYAVSDGSTWTVDGNRLTVISDGEVYTAAYTITGNRLSSGIFEGSFIKRTGQNIVFETDPAPTTYTITFNPSGGTVSPTSAATGTNGRLASLPTPTRSGYTFDGWYTAQTGGTAVTTTTTFSANTTIYARWTENSVTPPIGSTFTDSRDNKTYRKVTIGTQTWMAENLNYDVPNNVSGGCYDDDPTSCNTYGRFYNWSTAVNGSSSSSANPSGIQGVCPVGWHLPSAAEWDVLVDYAGGASAAGGKLKSTSGWYDNGNGTDEYGFSALPGGSGDYAQWWTASADPLSPSAAMRLGYSRSMYTESKEVYSSRSGIDVSASVRCVQDVGSTPTTYTVTFDANGGTGDVKPLTGTGITLPDGGNMSKQGYSFGGWNTQANGNGDNYRVGSTLTLTKDMVLYAVWTENSSGGGGGLVNAEGEAWVRCFDDEDGYCEGLIFRSGTATFVATENNGRTWYIAADEDGEQVYQYSASGNILTFTFPDGTETVPYSVSGNKLTLGDGMVFTKTSGVTPVRSLGKKRVLKKGVNVLLKR